MTDPTVKKLAGSSEWVRLIDQQSTLGEVGRRQTARKRLLIDREQHRSLIISRIADTHNSPVVLGELSRFVSTAINPLRRITDRVAVAYKVPPVRRLDGASEMDTRAWAAVTNGEGKIGAKAKQWGRYAFLLNTIHVIPKVVSVMGEKRLQYATILPHCSTVVQSEYEEDQPAILIYDLMTGDAVSESDPVRVAVDAEAFYTLSPRGAILDERRHNLGMCPATPFRVEEPPPGDYWNAARGSGMIDVTCDVGRVYATMEYVRKGQQRKLLTIYDPEMSMPEGQTAEPEKGVKINATRAEAEIDVKDFVTSVDEFVKEIRFLIEQAAEAYGIPSSLVDLDPSPSDSSNVSPQAQARNQAALAEVRQNQIESLRDCEKRLAYATALTLAAERHPLAVNPSVVRDSFQIEFPPLSYVDHPLKQLEVIEKMISLGFMDHAKGLQRLNPELSYEDAQALVEEHVVRRGEVTKLMAEHGVMADAGQQLDNVNQALGRLGGRPPSTPDGGSDNQ